MVHGLEKQKEELKDDPEREEINQLKVIFFDSGII
jgi:hypothetical protein